MELSHGPPEPIASDVMACLAVEGLTRKFGGLTAVD
jgi:hypothetical protein